MPEFELADEVVQLGSQTAHFSQHARRVLLPYAADLIESLRNLLNTLCLFVTRNCNIANQTGSFFGLFGNHVEFIKRKGGIATQTDIKRSISEFNQSGGVDKLRQYLADLVAKGALVLQTDKGGKIRKTMVL